MYIIEWILMKFEWRNEKIRDVHEVGVEGHLGVSWGHCWNIVKMLSFSTEFKGYWCNLDEVIIEYNKLGVFRNLQYGKVIWGHC